MARIVHIALKVEDLDKTSEFYEKVFGFIPTETSKVRDHTSRHLSDGAIDLALIKYDSEESAEAKAAGQGPCIHHFAIEVDDMDKSVAEIGKFGCDRPDPGRSIRGHFVLTDFDTQNGAVVALEYVCQIDRKRLE